MAAKYNLEFSHFGAEPFFTTKVLQRTLRSTVFLMESSGATRVDGHGDGENEGFGMKAAPKSARARGRPQSRFLSKEPLDWPG